MQEHIQNELASFIANCDWEKIAPHFKEDAAYRVLDWIGSLWPESTIPK